VNPVLLAVLGLAQPDAAFHEGVELRHDATAARSKFIEAAKGYDAAWKSGDHTAVLAANRLRAHALAGDLPGAIAAAHGGLQVASHDVELRRDLETLRDAVAYPPGLRPEPITGWRSRISAWDLFIFTTICVLFIVIGLARRFTVRDGWSLPVAGIGAVGMLLAMITVWQWNREKNREAERPLLVLTRDTSLRKGNGDTHPPRLDAKLPRGAEVRELHRRGGWVQVEVASGAIGWIPQETVIPIG
jgi:hypothetical protein